MGAIEHRDDDAGIEAEVRRVGLGDLLDGLPLGLDTPLTRALRGGRDLSGGQWQRLALARGLMREAPLLTILDEPTASLDPRHRFQLVDALRRRARAGATVVLSTHELDIAAACADEAVLLRAGRVEAAGPLAETLRPERLAALFGVSASVSILPDGRPHVALGPP